MNDAVLAVCRAFGAAARGFGVISPLLANVYLHYVLDVWFEREVQPLLRGKGSATGKTSGAEASLSIQWERRIDFPAHASDRSGARPTERKPFVGVTPGHLRVQVAGGEHGWVDRAGG